MEGGIVEQTRQSLTNVSEVLKAAGSSLDKVVKTTVFLKDMNDFAAMNEVYASVRKKKERTLVVGKQLNWYKTTVLQEPPACS